MGKHFSAIFGGASGDWLYGQGGNDQLCGKGGNGRLYGDYDSGSSILHGSAGNNTLIARNNLADHLFNDSGNDSALPDANDALSSVEGLRT